MLRRVLTVAVALAITLLAGIWTGDATVFALLCMGLAAHLWNTEALEQMRRHREQGGRHLPIERGHWR